MTIFAEELGTVASSGEAIVFLPGGGLSSWSWRPVAEQLSEFRCFLVALPEHGRSSDVRPFTMQLAASEVRNLIEGRCGGRAHVVGLSLGAQDERDNLQPAFKRR